MPDNQTPFLFDVPTVSEFTGKIKSLIESNFVDVLVEGEASNVKKSANGHVYFTLKDSGAQLPCVLWRATSQRMGIDLVDGQQVVVGGDLQVYAPHGRYQMIVNLVQQAGIGKLQKAFEELKTKLKTEGLFDDIHKKPIPRFPSTIGVVTSEAGAAFQDIRSTLEKRWPLATVLLHHASVQGPPAAAEIVKGISYFAERKNVDVLIIGRGGGSLEDLWPFNEEAVARAVFDCPIPVISGVGHEVDFSISDFVADSRAATPTQAAVIATPDINDIRFQLEDHRKKLDLNVIGAIQYYKDRVEYLAKSHALLAVQQKIAHARTKIGRLKEQMDYKLASGFSNRRQVLTTAIHKLEKTNPNEPLDRGFTRIWQDEKWIRKSSDLEKNSNLEIEWKDKKISLS